jgi:hypothetical protein
MEARGTHKRIRGLRQVALALVVAGVAAPAAQANYPSEGVGASASPARSMLVSGERKSQLSGIQTSDLAVRGEIKTDVRGIQTSDTVVRGDDKRGIRDVGPVSTPAAPSGDTSNYAWRDVGIGAAGALTLALLGASLLIAFRRNRKSDLATA